MVAAPVVGREYLKHSVLVREPLHQLDDTVTIAERNSPSLPRINVAAIDQDLVAMLEFVICGRFVAPRRVDRAKLSPWVAAGANVEQCGVGHERSDMEDIGIGHRGNLARLRRPAAHPRPGVFSCADGRGRTIRPLGVNRVQNRRTLPQLSD